MDNVNNSIQRSVSTFHVDNLASDDQARVVKGTHSPALVGEAGKVPKPIVSSCTKVFVAYNHKDTKWLKRVQIHFRPLEQRGMIELWDHSKIAVGAKWKEEIQEVIHLSTIIILIVSADFLASDFLTEYELPKLLSHAEANGATIMPIIVAPCLLEGSGIEVFQTLNPLNKPLSEMKCSAQEATIVKLVEAVNRRLRQAKEEGKT
jgi:hypothetical protein